MLRTTWARCPSIAGHPALLMPLAVAGGSGTAGAGPGARDALAAGLALGALAGACFVGMAGRLTA